VEGDDKVALVAMLRSASELEHELCCQYLYAAFSLKAGGDLGLTPSQASRAAQWNQQITKIAVQEMSHLMMASNLLTAIGGEPWLWRPNFPQPPRHYSEIGLPSMLAPLDLQTASRFMCWEKPDTPDPNAWWIDFCAKAAAVAAARVAPAAAVARTVNYGTIGALYREINEMLSQNEAWIDPGTKSRQVTSELIAFAPPVPAVTTLELATKTINLIVLEGEGTPEWTSMSHFAYFHQIVNELKGEAPTSDAFAPAWPTVENPAYAPDDAPPGANVIEDPAAVALGVLFNDVYRLLLTFLGRLFIPHDETESQRAILANVALGLMPLVIGQLGTLLTRVPAGDRYPGLYAGPSFELPPQRDPKLLAHGARDDVWGDLQAQLSQLAGRARLLAIDPPAKLVPFVFDIGVAAKNLEKFVPLLDPAGVAAR
jgi:hypothetical protein